MTFEAGVFEYQFGLGFMSWSRHATYELAVAAAVKYARGQTAAVGSFMSWAGGVRAPDGAVTWYDRDGEVVDAAT